MTLKIWHLLLFLFFISSNSFSANYYVSTTGDDANDGSAANPWRNIQKAADTMVAGDKVTVRAGVYMEPIVFDPTAPDIVGIHPVNSGEPGNPIVYEGETGAIIDQNFIGDGFFIHQKNYITIRGFEIRNTRRGITTKNNSSATTISGRCTGIIIENNYIHNINIAAGRNTAGVRLDTCFDCIVRNNRIHTVRVAGAMNQNGGGVLSYGMQNAIIENNEIYDVFTGVYHKRFSAFPGANQGSFVRNNIIRNSREGVRYGISGAGNNGHQNQTVNNNLFYDIQDACVLSQLDEAGTISSGLDIFNNTFDGCGVFFNGYQDVEIYNNIFYQASTAISTAGTTDPSRIQTNINYSDHNVYFPNANFSINLFIPAQQNFTSLTSWQAYTTVNPNGGFTATGAATHDSNSSTTNPQFISEGLRDYRTAVNLGDGRNDQGIGAYPTGTEVVGLGSTNVIKEIRDLSSP